MIFDATVSPAQQEVNVVEDHVVVTQTYAIPLPMNGQLVGLPVCQTRIPMGKKFAINFAEELLKAAEELPDETPESDLIVAQSLAGVEEIARDIGRIQQG